MLFQEFKRFIMRGNVIDMAVGIIIGVAFTNIINSLVNDILMPPLGLLIGRVDFSNLYINLSGQPFASLEEAQAAGAPTLNYGVFINTITNFLIIAFAVFLLVRWVNRLKTEEKPAEPNTKECPYCISQIPLKATRCPNCTSSLEEAPAT